MKRGDNDLYQLLGDLFPAGEVPDPDNRTPKKEAKGDGKEASREEKHENGEALLQAVAAGPEILADFLKHRAEHKGAPLLTVEMTETGATLRRSDGTTLEIDAVEVIWLQQVLTQMVEAQVARCHLLRVLKRLGLDNL